MRSHSVRLGILASALLAVASEGGEISGAYVAAPISLALDASEAPQRILHARLVIAARPGPLTLEYPKWIRGEHGPNGPIADLAGITFSAAGRPITWKRDDVDLYAFHCDVPEGAGAVEVHLDYLMPAKGGRYTEAISSTAQLLMLNWYQVLVYPQRAASDDVTVIAHLKLPGGWTFATALPVASEAAGDVEFKPASLTVLADSPVLAGAYMRAVKLGIVDGAEHELDIAADSAAAVEIRSETVANMKRLVAEFDALFGAHHYRSYHWLLALSDRFRRAGVEHHESSDDRFPERTLGDDTLLKLLPGLLAHEYAHSWNGKYRRPVGLSGADFEQPMKGDLLWVYEGLTTYLGTVMPVRAGFNTAQEFREHLAEVAAAMAHQAGRSWRSLEDTAVAAQVLYSSAEEWRSWRRGADFYPESSLIWLEADVIIRQQSGGARSLDDFCRRFFGAPNTPPMLKPYTFDEMILALDQVAKYDWRGFFATRIFAIAPEPPFGGIERAGWKLVYSSAVNQWQRAEETAWSFTDLTSSIGLRLKPTGAIEDVVPTMAAAKAGLAPGMTVIAVNGRAFSTDRLRQAIGMSADVSTPIELLVENDDYFHTYRIDYHAGERTPHLERDASRPDLLTAIVQPRAVPPGAN